MELRHYRFIYANWEVIFPPPIDHALPEEMRLSSRTRGGADTGSVVGDYFGATTFGGEPGG